MLRQAMKPNMVSYNALISACEKGKELRRAVKVCDLMQRQGIKPNIVSYNALINAK